MIPEFTLYLQLLIVLGADYLLGDPRLLPHPVRFIGWLCIVYERLARNSLGWLSMKSRGVVAFGMVLLTTLAALALFLFLLFQLGEEIAIFGAMLICYFCIAAGDLIAHSKKVYEHLRVDDLAGARRAVGLMVGRDTASLDSEGVARACVESVSENMVDGITAPLFWAFIGALVSPLFQLSPLLGAACTALGYKAINTMDSMYGYKNEQYLEFGWCAAKVDDLVNLAPARLSGVCLIGAAYLFGFDGKGALRVYRNERMRSTSPNSGHSEAAAAGALNIQLGGPSSYFGETTLKEYIGEGLHPVCPDDIKRVNKLIVCGSLLFFIICCILHLFWVIGVR